MRRFAFNQIVKHLRIQSAILQRRITCRPRKPFGRDQNHPEPKFSPLRVGSITTRNYYFKKPGGNLKEVLQKGGYRDFSRKIIPLPRLAANPTLTTPTLVLSGAHCINYSSKLMSAAQELFQLFFAATFRLAASFDGKTRVAEGFPACKRFAKVFSKSLGSAWRRPTRLRRSACNLLICCGGMPYRVDNVSRIMAA